MIQREVYCRCIGVGEYPYGISRGGESSAGGEFAGLRQSRETTVFFPEMSKVKCLVVL